MNDESIKILEEIAKLEEQQMELQKVKLELFHKIGIPFPRPK